MKKQLFPIIFLITILFTQVPFACAQTNILAVSSAEDGGVSPSHDHITTDWYNVTSGFAGLMTSFQPNASGYLHNVSLYMRKAYVSDPPTAVLYVRIHEAVGTFGVDASPGNAIAVDTLDANASLSTSFGWVDVDFSVDEPYLEQGHTYIISIISEDNTGLVPHELSSQSYVEWARQAKSGNIMKFQNYDWVSNVVGWQSQHRVYVNTTEAAPTATPVPIYPSAGGGATYIDYLIGQFINFFIPLVVMLIPAFLLGYVCRMGKWGYIIGLAIGSGLGVVFVPNFPVWLVFLISLGIIGFAYSEVKRGN